MKLSEIPDDMDIKIYSSYLKQFWNDTKFRIEKKDKFDEEFIDQFIYAWVENNMKDHLSMRRICDKYKPHIDEIFKLGTKAYFNGERIE